MRVGSSWDGLVRLARWGDRWLLRVEEMTQVEFDLNRGYLSICEYNHTRLFLEKRVGINKSTSGNTRYASGNTTGEISARSLSSSSRAGMCESSRGELMRVIL